MMTYGPDISDLHRLFYGGGSDAEYQFMVDAASAGVTAATLLAGASTAGLTPTAVKTANYTATAGQIVPVDTTSGNVTVTLPTAPSAGSRIVVKQVTRGGSNTVTVACGGSDVLNKTGGPTTLTLTLANQAAAVQYASGIWYVLGDDMPLSQLDLRYPLLAGGSTISGTMFWRGANDASAITWKPNGDGRAAVLEGVHNDTTGYLLHLLSGTSMAHTAALIACGVDHDGIGILIANKDQGVGINIDQRSTVTNTVGYGIIATQRSTAAPLVRLEMQTAAGADVLQLLSFTGFTGNLLYVGDKNGAAGVIDADSGMISWNRPIEVYDLSGGTANYVDVRDQNGTAAALRSHAYHVKTGLSLYNSSGSNNLWWPFLIKGSGSHMTIEAGGTTATVGTPGTTTKLIDFQNTKIGFFGATPVVQQTRSGALTDSSGGSAGSTVTAAPGAYSQSDEANFRASVAAKLNALDTALHNLGLTT